MIEVTEFPGDASSAPSAAATADTATANATAEKPKVTRRRVTKKAEPELPLEGVEEKPKRATRAKKVVAAEDQVASADGDGEAAPAKPKRATRAKKAEATTEATAEAAPVENAPAPFAPDQGSNAGPAPFQMAPAVAMGSFTPATQTPTQAPRVAANEVAPANSNGDGARENNEARAINGRDAETRAENGRGENNEARAENGRAAEARDDDGGDDDFRNGRLSYRDRRALRREQRIVSRVAPEGEDGEVSARDNRENADNRGNRDRENGGREARDREPREREPRERENGGRETRDNNDARGNRETREGSERPNRDGREREARGNRDNNRNGREPRDNSREPRDNNRETRESRREAREGRRDRGENGFSGGGSGSGRRREYDLPMLEALDGDALQAVVAELNMEEAPGEKSALIMAILEAQAASQNAILKTGILEILPDQKGFLRCEKWYPSEGDVYVSQTQIKRFGLKTGDEVLGTARVPKENERYHGLLRVESINGLSIEANRARRDFEKLTPIFPTERFNLETEPGNITARIIDLVSPVGKGQRGLIVAPPKAGKTTLIKSIANSIAENNPDAMLFVLLIDERPEEVTDISRSVRGEVVASTFDEVPENHMRVADIVMERAKRLVEMGHDVVVLMDSITRLSRASNLVVSPSGRTLSGGLDPAAMYRPKRMFGAARNIEEGGSLTMLATALVDTGSRMDEMIFEEFKGTGNLDLVLDRDLFNQRIFPAIDINRSGTRRDDLLMSKEELAATFHLRRTLAALDNDKAVTLLIDRLKNTKSNANFMEVVAKSQRNAPA